MARSIIALIMRVGGGASAAERAAGKVLHGKAHADSPTHPNSPYGTRSKGASLSTPNLSTLQRSVLPTPKAAKRRSPPSPILPTIRSNSSADANPTNTTRGGEWTFVREARDLSAFDPPGRLQRCVLCLHRKSPCYHHPRKIKFQSTILPT